MKIYTIIGGINGVGKSSFTGSIRGRRSDLGVIIDVDRLTASLGGDMLSGGKTALMKIDDCLERGVSFTQETTLSGRKTELTARRARELGYTVRLFYIALDSAEDCMERVENRVRRGGHNIREDDILRRFAGRWEALAKILPCCDYAELYDNYNGFVKVAEYENGGLIPIGDYRPRWLSELMEYLKTWTSQTSLN